MTIKHFACLATPLLLLAACDMPGERNDTGECPSGEVCSPNTPQGLTFDGADLGDQPLGGGIHATAIGGHQTFAINDPVTQSILRVPFTASTNGSACDVIDQSTGIVDIGAHAAGHDLLRIVDAGNGELMDRVVIQGGEVASVVARPSGFADIGLEGSSIGLWTGGVRAVVIALRDADGNRLVDESLVIEASTGDRNTIWDTVDLSAQPVGNLELTATLGSAAVHVVPVEVVDHATALAAQPSDHPGFRAGDLACFSPRTAGGADIFGAPFQFSVQGPATLAAPSSWFPNCASIATVTGTGDITVTAQVGALQATVTQPALPSARAVPAALAAVGPTPGERALTAAAME